MRCVGRVLSCLIGAIILLVPTLAIGKVLESVVHGCTGARKLSCEAIRLDSEQVTIRLGEQRYTVEAVLHFFNTGETTTEWTGFASTVGFVQKGRWGTGVLRFDAWVNGEKVRFSEERDLPKDSRLTVTPWPSTAKAGKESRRVARYGGYPHKPRWRMRRIRFPGHAKTTIRVNYEVLYSHPEPEYREASYMYGTGTYWKGPIRRAVFMIDSSAVGWAGNVTIDFPGALGPRRISDNLVRYEMWNIAPHPEAELRIRRTIPGLLWLNKSLGEQDERSQTKALVD